MEELLERARAADEELARARANAKPAGDPDPYKAPREESPADRGDAEAVEPAEAD
jgi:ribosome-binding factor A